MKKKKILFITPSFTKGGAEKNMLNIINSLSSDEFDIYHIICTKEIGYLSLLNKQINVYVLDKPDVKTALFRIFTLIRFIRPSIVFTSALHIAIPIIILKKLFFLKFKKITRIPTLPSNNLEKRNLKSKLLNLFRNKTISISTVVVAQTIQMKAEVISFYDVFPHKVIVINNIIDIETIQEKANEKVDLPKGYFYFVAAGSLYSIKGFDILIKAFSEYVNEYPNSRLIIMGKESVEKGYKKYLEDLINQFKLSKEVMLLGHQENPYKYFNFSDAFVLSSIKEGFPNVVLENLALSKPVIVTDCIDFEGIVNNKNGIIVEKRDINALSNAMIEIRNADFNKFDFKLAPNFDYNCWFKSL